MRPFDDELVAHRDAVYRQMLRMCGNHDDAEDVLVEAMTTAWRASEKLQQPDSFRAWLVQIGRRTCIRLKKKRTMNAWVALDELEEKGVLPLQATASPETDAEEQQLKECLLESVGKLPSSWRQAYQMVEIEGKSITEVADALGTTKNNIKVRVHRARKRLRRTFDQFFES